VCSSTQKCSSKWPFIHNNDTAFLSVHLSLRHTLLVKTAKNTNDRIIVERCRTLFTRYWDFLKQWQWHAWKLWYASSELNNADSSRPKTVLKIASNIVWAVMTRSRPFRQHLRSRSIVAPVVNLSQAIFKLRTNEKMLECSWRPRTVLPVSLIILRGSVTTNLNTFQFTSTTTHPYWPPLSNARSGNTAGTVNHTFSHYAQYSARESSLVPWTEHNILTK